MHPRVATYIAVVSLFLLGLSGLPAQAQQLPPAVDNLMMALQEMKRVTEILGDPAIDGEPAAIQRAVQQAKPHAMTVKMKLQATPPWYQA